MERTNLTSQSVTQGNFLSHISSQGEIATYDDGVEEENVGQLAEGDELVLNNNGREMDGESQEPENPFAIVAEKDSQVLNK